MANAAAGAAVTPPIDLDMAGLEADIRLYIAQSVAWFTHHWLQIVIACVVGAAIVAILFGIRLGAVWLCRKDEFRSRWGGVIGRVVSRTALWFMIVLAAKLVVASAAPPAAVTATVAVLFTVAMTLQAAIWAREAVLAVMEHRAGGDIETGAIGSAYEIVRVLVTFALFAIAIILILDNLGVNVTGLIAGLGIGGIAIGFAAQGIFADLFAALSIIFDKPFRRGDAIKWGSQAGTVEAIGLKTTRIRALTGEQVIIANSDLLKQTLHNMARLDRRRVALPFGIGYYTEPGQVAAVPGLAHEIVESIDKCKFLRCGMTAFGNSSLDFDLQFDVLSEDYNELFEARSAVCVAMIRRFAEAGIDFAWPTQVTIGAGADGRPTASVRTVADSDIAR